MDVRAVATLRWDWLHCLEKHRELWTHFDILGPERTKMKSAANCALWENTRQRMGHVWVVKSLHGKLFFSSLPLFYFCKKKLKGSKLGQSQTFQKSINGSRILDLTPLSDLCSRGISCSCLVSNPLVGVIRPTTLNLLSNVEDSQQIKDRLLRCCSSKWKPAKDNTKRVATFFPKCPVSVGNMTSTPVLKVSLRLVWFSTGRGFKGEKEIE